MSVIRDPRPVESYPKARREGLRVERLGSERLVYDLVARRAHSLNAAASEVFDAADGTRDPHALALLLSHGAGVPLPLDAVTLALDELGRAGLLERTEPRLPETTRRDLVRRLGLAAAAVPVVVTLAPPTAAQVQSQGVGTTGATGPVGATGPSGDTGRDSLGRNAGMNGGGAPVGKRLDHSVTWGVTPVPTNGTRASPTKKAGSRSSPLFPQRN